MNRNVIVCLNIANLTGTLNHGVNLGGNTYQKLRVDYTALLNFVVNDRNLLGAFVISQQDIARPKTQEQTDRGRKFLHGLKRLGWNICTLEYDSRTTSSEDLLAPVWETVLGPFTDEFGQLIFDPEQTDIVVITGTGSWFNIISAFYNAGLGVEIAYLQQATSKSLLNNFPFLDLTEFVLHSHNLINSPTHSVETHV